MTSSLSAAVASGNFSASVQAAAIVAGTTVLESVSVANVTDNGFVEYVSTPTPSSAPTILAVPSAAPSAVVTLSYANIFVNSGAAYGIDGTASLADASNGLSTSNWTRSFGTLFGSAPGSSSTFGIGLSGRKLLASSGSATSTTSKYDAHSIKIVASATSLRVESRSIKFYYQVLDQYGHPQLNAPTATKLYFDSVAGYVESTCGSADASSGVGVCSATIASSWFSDTTVEVYTWIEVTSSIGNITQSEFIKFELTATAVYDAISEATLIATLPQKNFYAGDLVEVVVTASTNGQCTSTVLCLSIVTPPLLLITFLLLLYRILTVCHCLVVVFQVV